MKVTNELIDQLAHLARLEFSSIEKEELKADLERMISFVEKLNEVDTEGVEPLLHMSDEINVLREDAINGSVSSEEALKNAQNTYNGFFVVPYVFEEAEDVTE